MVRVVAWVRRPFLPYRGGPVGLVPQPLTSVRINDREEESRSVEVPCLTAEQIIQAEHFI